MAAKSRTSEDRERHARARAFGKREAHDRSVVTAARYIGRRDAIELEFAGRGTMTIPRQAIAEPLRGCVADVFGVYGSAARQTDTSKSSSVTERGERRFGRADP
jgi:hypothetical protein